jgi:hypothetical protein
MLKRFVARVSKLPEVRLVIFQNNCATIVIDRVQAKTYLRINGLMESVNKKLYFGKPMAAAVRDEVTPEELRRMLKEPGVLYVREDALETTRPAG